MRRDPEAEIRQLVASLAAIPVREHHSEIAKTLKDVLDYAQHNECGLAVEILCENLYEYAFSLPQSLLVKIEALVNWLGTERGSFERLLRLTT